MRPYMRTAALPVMAAVCFFLFSSTSEAAWTRGKGQWFAADSLSTYRTTHFIDDDGNRIRQPRFGKQEWNAYLEYGWRDDVTVGANLFFHRLTADYARYHPTANTVVTGTDRNYGLADPELFLRKRLWQGQLLGKSAVLSVQPLLKAPGFYYYGGNPRSGTDTFDAELRLQGGINFSLLGHSHFATADLAYRKRFGQWRDQFRADTTLGFNLSSDFTLLMQNFVTRRVEGTARRSSTSAQVNDYDLVKSQASIVYRVNNTTRVQLGAFRHMYARNTGDGEGFLLSLWREF